MKPLLVISTAIGLCVGVSNSALASEPNRPSDDEVQIEITHPIPMDSVLPGCKVQRIERVCRTDGLPVHAFKVVKKDIVGKSAIESMQIQDGCVVAQLSLGVEISTQRGAQCIGGEALVKLRIVLSTRVADR